MPRQVFGQFEIQTLVHRGHHTLHQQAGDQVFGAHAQLFRQVFYADAFTNGDGSRDGKRLVRQRQTRRWNKALHRAFFFPWDVGLPWASRWPARTRRSSRRRRWPTWAYSTHSGARRITTRPRRACWVRTTALFARSALIWRARSRRTSGAGRPWPLENRLSANHPLRTLAWSTLALHGSCSRSALHGASWRSTWRSRTRRRRGVNGTRACLRCDHSSLLHNRLARH